MATLSDIQTRIKYWTKRNVFYDAQGNDITSSALTLFTNNAMVLLQRFLPVKQAIEASWTVTIGPGNHPFQVASLTTSPTFNPTSATFRYDYDLWFSSAGKGITPIKPLRRYADIREYHRDFPDPSLGVVSPTTGAPQGWVIYGQPQAIVLGPYPDVSYCVTPNTRILCADLTWRCAGDLRTGDELIGFDDAPAGTQGKSRYFRKAFVTGTSPQKAPVYRIILDDGTELHSTADHRWIVVRERHPVTTPHLWMRTDKLTVKARCTSVPIAFPKFFHPWTFDEAREAGYLAAAFDSEGSIHFAHGKSHRLGFCQKPGEVLDRVSVALKERNYDFHRYHEARGVDHLVLNGGRADVYKFLGSIRPSRLLTKWRQKRFDSDNWAMKRIALAHIETVEPTGEHEIAAISSSTGTYIAEGFGAHNTGVLTGVMWLPQLVGANDTNWYMTGGNADDALTFLACQEAAVWLQDDALAAFFEKMAQDKLKQILRAMREFEVSEGDLIAQLPG